MMRHEEKELASFKYHGKLESDVTLDFGDQSITLGKDIEYVILIVMVDKETKD
jgi:hypothetical protein